jgi:hypothetical protein
MLFFTVVDQMKLEIGLDKETDFSGYSSSLANKLEHKVDGNQRSI